MRGGRERTEHGRGEGEGGGIMEDKEEGEEGQWNMEEGRKRRREDTGTCMCGILIGIQKDEGRAFQQGTHNTCS